MNDMCVVVGGGAVLLPRLMSLSSFLKERLPQCRTGTSSLLDSPSHLLRLIHIIDRLPIHRTSTIFTVPIPNLNTDCQY